MHRNLKRVFVCLAVAALMPVASPAQAHGSCSVEWFPAANDGGNLISAGARYNCAEGHYEWEASLAVSGRHGGWVQARTCSSSGCGDWFRFSGYDDNYKIQTSYMVLTEGAYCLFQADGVADQFRFHVDHITIRQQDGSFTPHSIANVNGPIRSLPCRATPHRRIEAPGLSGGRALT